MSKTNALAFPTAKATRSNRSASDAGATGQASVWGSRLPEKPSGASVKLVAVTGYAKDPEALAASGFDGHLAKPVDFDQLEETLATVHRGAA